MKATAVNAQITDAVTQVNVPAGAAGPALAVDMSLQTYAHAMGIAIHNAVAAQARTQVVAIAAVAAAAAKITGEGRA